MKVVIIFVCFIFFSVDIISAQSLLKGVVMDKKLPEAQMGVQGVNVYWLNTTLGTTTDQEGRFEISYKPSYKRLVIGALGYKPDTLEIKNSEEITHFLTENEALKEVLVSAKRDGISKSLSDTKNVFTVNSSELLRAACCNLSESFQTNPSIDVNFSDALTGTRQIQMLGLKSPYLLITQENIPMVRGASQVYGMTFIPGTWIESIQITKGAGSVVNGFESISGQINTELVKPLTDNAVFVNAYGNMSGKTELNVHLNKKIHEKWDTGLYLHSNYLNTKSDKNADGFLDNPRSKQINILNRWQYTNVHTGLISFLNFRYMNDKKQTGQLNFNPKTARISQNAWGAEIKTERYDASMKLGYVFPELPFQSVGLQLAYSGHHQNSYFGRRDYNIGQQSVYANAIFNSIIGNTQHKFKTGLSFAYDFYDEAVETKSYDREEKSVGSFFEYTYDDGEKFSATAGLRADRYNVLGTFFTPRLHLRYNIWEDGVFRASAGRGKRIANIFAENQQLFASSRVIDLDKINWNIHKLTPEIAWNYGASLLQVLKLLGKEVEISVDFYQTDFKHKVIVDWEKFGRIAFYNLAGKSTARSLQVEINLQAAKNFQIHTAYKHSDVQTDYQTGKRSEPLLPKYRFFASGSYEILGGKDKKWKFELTYNYKGRQRLPDTEGFLPHYSESYGLLSAQITRVFSKRFEVYLGGENLTNYRQTKPILAHKSPFTKEFDATLIYAPVFGRAFYAGLRFKIPKS